MSFIYCFLKLGEFKERTRNENLMMKILEDFYYNIFYKKYIIGQYYSFTMFKTPISFFFISKPYLLILQVQSGQKAINKANISQT